MCRITQLICADRVASGWAAKLEGWKLDSFVLRDLLRGGGLETKSAAVRRRLFGWIAANPDQLGRDDWPAVRALPIWPATDASLHSFDGLCLPDAKVAAALGSAIAKPAREVRSLAAKARKGKSKLTVRTEPVVEEIRGFYMARTNPFWLGAPLNDDQRRSFHVFESVLAMLGRNKALAPLLRALRDDAIAVARDGVIRPAASLVRETAEVRLLALLPNYLIDRPDQELDAIMPPARRPSARMALDALHTDTGNERALLPRLAVITASTDPMIADELMALACLPYEGALVAPDALAFKGNLGDYWGGWKRIIGAQSLSDGAQDLYRAAGVIRSFPNAETSRAYFEWLPDNCCAMLSIASCPT